MPLPILISNSAPPPTPSIIVPSTGSVSSVVRYPFLHVDVDGVLIPNVFSFTASFGYDLAVSECTIVCPLVPANLNYWSVVGVRAGANQGSAQTRFNGFCIETDYTFYPRDVSIICRGPLVRAQLVECSTAGGVDLSAGGAGQTDQAIIQQLLSAAGATAGGPIPLSIGGLGRTLGTVATKYYLWAENQAALDMIQQLDQICLGYRTFDTPGGGIQRMLITATPATTAALTFTEGVDIFSATPQVSILDTKTRVQVTGYDPGTGAFNYTIEQFNPLMPLGYVTDQISSNLIESSATGGTGVSAQEVATWWLGETNRAIGKYTFVTPRDDIIIPGMTIAIAAPIRLGVNQTFWVQHVDISIDQTGVFSQQIIAIAGMVGVPGSGQGGQPPIGTPTGGSIGGGGPPPSGGSPPGQGTNPPTNTPPVVDFTVAVQSEEVIVSGSYTLLYDVQCTASATGTSAPISSYAWSCSAGTPTSSTDDTYVFYVSSITGSQSISLTVTDGNGTTATITHTLQPPATGQVVTRKLYLAGTDCAEVFDGTIFDTSSGSGITTVANGPIWGDSSGDVITSTDDLTTTSYTTPFYTTTALWFDSSTNNMRILAGSGSGQIAVSNDGGQTWTYATNPSNNPILRCIISDVRPSQWFALASEALYRTDNNGAGWVVVLAAGSGESFLDVSLSFARNMIVMSGGRKMIDFTGTPQTLPAGFGTPIAITAHIRKDVFYIIDGSGNTAYHATPGSATLTAGQALPGGSAQPRGLYRDGQIVDLIYIAAGPVVYKSTDGLRTSGGYHVLRQAGVSTAPSGATYTQIGADGTLAVPAISQTTIYSTSTYQQCLDLGQAPDSYWPPIAQNLAYALSQVPAGWNLPGFNDIAWAATMAESGSAGFYQAVPSADFVMSTYAIVANNKTMAFRKTFSLPAGRITTATLFVNYDDVLLGLWINGTWICSNDQMPDQPRNVLHPVPYGTFPVPPGILLPGASNVLAAIGYSGAGNEGLAFSLAVS